ncbi:MAG TPA: hypothetical protein VN207_10225, partial [Ktedonobacteraceae bacterium]|nr:hypothetical protein [Ktedonobacteraceae bacterium]
SETQLFYAQFVPNLRVNYQSPSMAVAEPEYGRTVKYVVDQPVKPYDGQFTNQVLDYACLVSAVVDQPVELVDSFSLSRPHSGSEAVILGFNPH